jgi:hypothetical protein
MKNSGRQQAVVPNVLLASRCRNEHRQDECDRQATGELFRVSMHENQKRLSSANELVEALELDGMQECQGWKQVGFNGTTIHQSDWPIVQGL